mmetsp:Transcript_11150/g.28265  ORF Transcript_11150/g.28265 Transcript_11150/m.28265 type:complete len:316 (-) Transcript_11150:765-1712(-)
MLPVGDQKGADVTVVQVLQEFVDSWIHDGLSHQRKSAVLDRVGLLPSLGIHTGDAFCLLDHLDVSLDGLIDDKVGVVRLPAPRLADGIFVVSPAKDALVGACQTRGGFHALITRNSIKGVFVAASASTKLVLGPAAELDGAVGTNQFVSLLLERFCLLRRDHLFRFLGFHFAFQFRRFHDRSEVFHIDHFGFILVLLCAFFFVIVVDNQFGKNVVIDPRLQDTVLVARGIVSHSHLFAKDLGTEFSKLNKGLLGGFPHAVVLVVGTPHAHDGHLHLVLEGMLLNPPVILEILQSLIQTGGGGWPRTPVVGRQQHK